jgi:formylglycine-generating enzyme required for sulfatase activity
MLEGLISVLGGFNTAHETYKRISGMIRGDKDKSAQYLETMCEHLGGIRGEFERLSDKILYAPDMQAVHDTTQSRQRVEHLRNVLEYLEPVQKALDEDILSSAIVLTPDKMQQALNKSPWEVLIDVRPANLVTKPNNPDLLPILFAHSGMHYIGWQMRGTLPILFNCEFDELWLPGKTSHGTVKPVAPEMVTVPAGIFMMGSNDYDDEKPVHRVTISKPFAMGKYPVTVGDFKQFVLVTGYETEAETGDGSWIWTGKEWDKRADANWLNPYFIQTDDHPVVCISWNDAQKYCQWLSKQTGQQYRLPTEAEWEYACRAGSSTKWCFGDDESQLQDYAWYDKNSGGKTHPVGEKKPNKFGLYDMHGNVWEWCEDSWHENYKGAPTDGSAWKNSNENRSLLRGGSWGNIANYCRSASRDRGDQGNRDNDNGVRLVCGVRA